MSGAGLAAEGVPIPRPPDVAEPFDLQREAPRLSASYTAADAAADEQRELVSLAWLPPWPPAPGEPEPASGHGWRSGTCTCSPGGRTAGRWARR